MNVGWHTEVPSNVLFCHLYPSLHVSGSLLFPPCWHIPSLPEYHEAYVTSWHQNMKWRSWTRFSSCGIIISTTVAADPWWTSQPEAPIWNLLPAALEQTLMQWYQPVEIWPHRGVKQKWKLYPSCVPLIWDIRVCAGHILKPFSACIWIRNNLQPREG